MNRLKNIYWQLHSSCSAFFEVLWLLRWSLAISIVTSLVILVPEQSLEGIQAFVEDSQKTWRLIVWFYVLACAQPLVLWYWSRFLLDSFRPISGRKHGVELWASRHLPRIVAVLPLLAMSLAFFHASRLSIRMGNPGVGYYHTIVTLLLACIVYWFLVVRTRMFKRWHDTSESLALGLVSLLLWVGAMVVFTLKDQSATSFGPLGVVFIWTTVWTCFGNFLVYFGNKSRFPVITTLVLLAVVLSYFDLNDNHSFRTVAEKSEGQVAKQNCPRNADFNEKFKEWIAKRPDGKDPRYENDYPVFLIAAEGGGIRAAYYTATLLAKIQDTHPEFAHHVFAISGVSGGSVGASVFCALLSRYEPNSSRASKPVPGFVSFTSSTEQILGQDFLSPLLARGLFPDLAQRFLPVPFRSLDRALALEKGLERAWKDATGGSEFESSFSALYHDSFSSRSVPALFLNTTQVETGEQVILCALKPKHEDCTTLRCDLEDDLFGPHYDLPLSTAAFLSARFPIITPAGSYSSTSSTEKKKIRLVDGGYFENSGASTLLELVKSLIRIHDQEIRPFSLNVIIIQYDEKAKGNTRRSYFAKEGMGEIMSPIRALLNSRAARGAYAVQQVVNEAVFWTEAKTNLQVAINKFLENHRMAFTKDHIIDPAIRGELNSMLSIYNLDRDPIFFVLGEEAYPLPLGWQLSSRAREEIRDQIDGTIIPPRLSRDGLQIENGLKSIEDVLKCEGIHGPPQPHRAAGTKQ